MAEKFENVLFECLSCEKVFRVHKPVGEVKILEPCPDCKKSCIRRLPQALDLEFTNACQLRCKMCPRGKPDYSRKVGYMSEEVFGPLCTEIAKWNQVQPGTVKLVWAHMFGEPLTHPHFCEWVDRLRLAGVGTTMVSTNAIPLDGNKASAILASSLNTLIVSVDAVTKETYEKIRGGDFDKVQENVDQLLALAKQRVSRGLRIPQIWIQLLKLNENEDEWLEFARRYTGNARLKAVTPKGRQKRPIPGLGDGSAVFFKTVERFGGQYDEAREQIGWDGADERRLICDKPFKRMSIWWDGRVPSPACCYTADEGPILGSVTDGQSLHGVWMSEEFWKVRDGFLEFQKTGCEDGLLELCKDC